MNLLMCEYLQAQDSGLDSVHTENLQQPSKCMQDSFAKYSMHCVKICTKQHQCMMSFAFTAVLPTGNIQVASSVCA